MLRRSVPISGFWSLNFRLSFGYGVFGLFCIISKNLQQTSFLGFEMREKFALDGKLEFCSRSGLDSSISDNIEFDFCFFSTISRISTSSIFIRRLEFWFWPGSGLFSLLFFDFELFFSFFCFSSFTFFCSCFFLSIFSSFFIRKLEFGNGSGSSSLLFFDFDFFCFSSRSSSIFLSIFICELEFFSCSGLSSFLFFDFELFSFFFPFSSLTLIICSSPFHLNFSSIFIWTLELSSFSGPSRILISRSSSFSNCLPIFWSFSTISFFSSSFFLFSTISFFFSSFFFLRTNSLKSLSNAILRLFPSFSFKTRKNSLQHGYISPWLSMLSKKSFWSSSRLVSWKTPLKYPIFFCRSSSMKLI